MLITPDITPYREQKLRILNGSHTISVPLCFLSGLNTVYESMSNEYMRTFFRTVIMEEIVPTIKDACPQAPAFAEDVLDRFANPYIAHKLISITFQESSKMNARNILTIARYYKQKHIVPQHMALGFAAMLLFLRPAKEENGVYYGLRGTEYYTITDDNAAIFADYWKNENVALMVKQICEDKRLWEVDLGAIPDFRGSVVTHLQEMLQNGLGTYLD
jgi:tagaturonate reductase